MLARAQTGEAVAPAGKERAPLFRDFAARYRERRCSRWKPSSLKTFDTYLRGRLMPRFGNMRLDRLDHASGAANRAFEILRAILRTARQCCELVPDAPDVWANIVMNPRGPVARHLDRHRAAHP